MTFDGRASAREGPSVIRVSGSTRRVTQQAELNQLDSRRIPATSEHTCLQLPSQETTLVFASEVLLGRPKLRSPYLWQGVAATPLRATCHGQKNCRHHHPGDSAPGSKALALRRIRQQSAGSKAPPPWSTNIQAAHGKLASVGQFDSRRTRLAFDVGVAGMSPQTLRPRLSPSNLNSLRAYFSFANIF